jgi:fructokinase
MLAETGLYGGIELGGTKTLVAVGDADGRLFARATLPTTTPDALLPQIATFFADHSAGRDLVGLGVGAFGPIVIDTADDDYGHLLETNKPGWSGFDLVGALRSICTAPITLVTDVAAAGVAEARLGALRGVELGIYLTVGTGIGGAILYRGQVLPALLHPEMGHLPIQAHPDDPAGSICRFHSNCAEGLAAGPAIMARFGASLSDFVPGGPEHQLIADYLGQLCATLVLAVSPQRIVIGGGVGKTRGLVDAVQAAMLRQLGGYAGRSAAYAGFLRSPALDQDAGIVGALCCGANSAGAREA